MELVNLIQLLCSLRKNILIVLGRRAVYFCPHLHALLFMQYSLRWLPRVPKWLGTALQVFTYAKILCVNLHTCARTQMHNIVIYMCIYICVYIFIYIYIIYVYNIVLSFYGYCCAWACPASSRSYADVCSLLINVFFSFFRTEYHLTFQGHFCLPGSFLMLILSLSWLSLSLSLSLSLIFPSNI